MLDDREEERTIHAAHTSRIDLDFVAKTMGEEVMNNSDPQEFADFLSALFVWIQSSSFRLSALELLVREKLNVTEPEVAQSLQGAQSEFVPPNQPYSFPELTEMLKRATEL